MEWQIDKFFPSLAKEQVYAPLRDEEFWKTVKPKAGAVDAVKHLIDAGDEVYVLTNSHYKALASKMENVLFKYFPFLTWNNVIIASNKQMVRGDVLIDDAIHNLVGGDYYRILMDAPYNRSIDDVGNFIYRAYNWDDVMIAIEGRRKTLKEIYELEQCMPEEYNYGLCD